MNIFNVNIINKNIKKNLLVENDVSKFKDSILQNIDILVHIDTLKELKMLSDILMGS